MGVQRRAVVVGTAGTAGIALAAGLAGRGWEIVADPDPADPVVPAPSLVVHAAVPAAAATATRLATMDGRWWDAACEQVLRSTLATLQAAHRDMTGPGGTVVVVVPTLALVGAAWYTAWSAAAEGQRAMVKAAARQWGGDSITVNAVVVPPGDLAGDAGLDALSLSVQHPAFPDADPLADLVDVVALLTRPEARHLTGATLAADGGGILAP